MAYINKHNSTTGEFINKFFCVKFIQRALFSFLKSYKEFISGRNNNNEKCKDFGIFVVVVSCPYWLPVDYFVITI